MRKPVLAFLLLGIGIFLSIPAGREIKNEELSMKTLPIQQKLQYYLQDFVNDGSYSDCKELKDVNVFFDFVYFPYKKKGEYLVSFMAVGYGLTDLGNVTSCAGGGENIIVKDNGENISLVYKFDEFREKLLPKDAVKLLINNNKKNTTYDQAKKYFNIDENKKISQKCPKNLCNKTWYQIIENDNKNNYTVFVYSTIPPKEMESGKMWWVLNFVDNHDMTENDRLCPNNYTDGRCTHLAKWKIVNKNTISYPLAGDPSRSNRIELIEVSKDTLKFIHLYD